MTRLTADLVRGIGAGLPSADRRLRSQTGMGYLELASNSLGMKRSKFDLGTLTVAAVPLTSGLGVIPGFSRALADIAVFLGFRSFVTGASDGEGIREGLAKGADILLMADDELFAAVDAATGSLIDNSTCTALGYTFALQKAMGGWKGRRVLVLGYGKVGTLAAEIIARSGGVVSVSDPDPLKMMQARRRLPSARFVDATEDEVKDTHAVFNASPESVPGAWLRQGVTVSSPGVPYSYDSEAEAKARAIIHDPLQLSTSVMLMWSAGISIFGELPVVDLPPDRSSVQKVILDL